MKKPPLCRWLFAGVFALSFSLHAASFDCSKARSASEKTICADTVLSRQDDALAASWKAARNRHGDASALRAQRDWSARRDTCGSNVTCLQASYRQRLAELAGTSAGSGAEGLPFQQKWTRDSPNDSVGSTLVINGTRPLHFSVQAWNGANTGTLEGDAVQDTPVHARYDAKGCRLDFLLRDGTLVVQQKEHDGGCGAGMGVDYGGSYISAAQAATRPKPDLHGLGIVSSASADASIRRLLGTDYDTLVDDVNMRAVDNAAGATTTQVWVRGIANTNAAILIDRASREFWIGLLVFDQGNHVRLRYYTNVLPDKRKLPAAIGEWRDRIDPSLPIDMMP
jgi:uncharacterized protein